MSTTPGFPSGNSRWTKIRDLFDEASRLEPEARESWLRDLTDDAEIRQTVHRLLAAHERFDHSEMRPGQEHVDDALSRFASFAATEADTAIGDFRVGRLLGEGGMGRVYYATRTIGGNDMSLSKAYSNAGRRDEAMVLFRKLVEISRQLFGDRSTSICQHYYDLADNYVSEYLEYRLGEYFLTKATLEACPPEATYLPYVYRRLGEVMLELGRYDAEPYVLEGLRLMAQTRPGSDDHHFAMANLAFMYFRKYRFDEAATLLTPAVVAEVRAINPAFAGNTFRELQHEVDEMAAFYGM